MAQYRLEDTVRRLGASPPALRQHEIADPAQHLRCYRLGQPAIFGRRSRAGRLEKVVQAGHDLDRRLRVAGKRRLQRRSLFILLV